MPQKQAVGKGFAVAAEQKAKLATDNANSAVNTRNLIEFSINEIDNGDSITGKTAAPSKKSLTV